VAAIMKVQQVVLASVALAGGLIGGYVLAPWLGASAPFVTAFAAVAAAEWAAGFIAAIAVAGLSFPAVTYMLTTSTGALAGMEAETTSALTTYTLTCAVIIALGESLRAGYERERDARQLLRTTLRGLRIGVMTTDADGWVTSMNTTAELLTGWPEADALRHSCHEVLRVTVSDPRVLTRRDGLEMPIEISVTVIRDDEDRVRGRVHVFRDITETRRLERERGEQVDALLQLQQASERRERELRVEAAMSKATFDAFFEQAPVFAALLEPGGKVVAANRLAAMGCGYTKEQVVDRLFWVAPWWSPSPALAEEIKAAALGAATGAIFRDEVAYYMVEGVSRSLDLTIRPIFDERGAVVLLAAMGIDVTERKRLRDEAQQLASELAETFKRTH
jgi:PAS domain S-box-containing protein